MKTMRDVLSVELILLCAVSMLLPKAQCQQQDRPPSTRGAGLSEPAERHHTTGLLHTLPHRQVCS